MGASNPSFIRAMLGSLFILTVIVVILSFVISAIGDDITHLWRSLQYRMDPDLHHIRETYRSVRKH